MLHKYISPFLITICFALSLFLLSGCSKDQSASDSGYIAPDSISFEEYTSLLFQSEVTSDTPDPSLYLKPAGSLWHYRL